MDKKWIIINIALPLYDMEDYNIETQKTKIII